MTLSVFGDPLGIPTMILRIALAFVLSAVLGLEREIKHRPAGIRTHLMVCLGATLISLIEQQTIANAAALANPQINVSVGRISAGVLQGIGFLGAGTIIMSEKKVTGLTTAASLWCTACLGIAIGGGYIVMAIALWAAMICVMNIKEKILRIPSYKKIRIEYINRYETGALIENYFKQKNVKVLDLDFHTEVSDDEKKYISEYSLLIPWKTDYVKMAEELADEDNICAVQTSNI